MARDVREELRRAAGWTADLRLPQLLDRYADDDLEHGAPEMLERVAKTLEFLRAVYEEPDETGRCGDPLLLDEAWTIARFFGQWGAPMPDWIEHGLLRRSYALLNALQNDHAVAMQDGNRQKPPWRRGGIQERVMRALGFKDRRTGKATVDLRRYRSFRRDFELAQEVLAELMEQDARAEPRRFDRACEKVSDRNGLGETGARSAARRFRTAFKRLGYDL